MSDETKVTDTATDDTNAVEEAKAAEANQKSLESELTDEGDKKEADANADDNKDDEPEKDEKEGDKEDKKEASDDNLDDFKLPEGYTLPDANKAIAVELAKEFNLNKDQAQKLIDKYIEATELNKKAIEDAQLQEWNNMKEDWENSLKKDWGINFDKNQKLVDKTLTKLIGEDKNAREYLDESAYNLNPHVRKMILKVGKMISEDSFESGEKATKTKSLAQSLTLPGET